MKTTTTIITLLAIFFSMSVQAEAANKERLLRFAKSVGIYQQIEEQKLAVQQQGAQVAQQYVQQITASTPDLPDQFMQDMEEEMNLYLSNVASLIDAEVAVDAYTNLISKKLSASEIEELTVFYESELGQKFTQSNTEIMGDWTLTFMEDFDQKLMVHLQSFVNNIMAKASNYNS